MRRKAPLIRKAEKRALRRRNPEDPSDVAFVKVRDGCVAQTLGAPDPCRDTWGQPFDPRRRPDLLEADHIRPAPMMGDRGPGGRRWMVGACPWHHRLGNPPWNLTHRAEIRAYLERLHGEVAA